LPLYEYFCKTCDHGFETLIRSAGDRPSCPQCGNLEVSKQFSVPAMAQTGRGRGSELPISAEGGGAPFGCGRPQCGAGRCAGLE